MKIVMPSVNKDKKVSPLPPRFYWGFLIMVIGGILIGQNLILGLVVFVSGLLLLVNLKKK